MDPGETGSYTLQIAMTGICVLPLILSFSQEHRVNRKNSLISHLLVHVLSACSIPSSISQKLSSASHLHTVIT